LHHLAEHFALDIIDLLDDAYPLHYKLIAQHQKNQNDLLLKLSKKDSFFFQIPSWRR
jgi:hypothetical protein